MNEAFRNILVISHENIGDIILSSAALKLLRQQYPEARITLLTSKVCRGIMEDGEVVNEAIWDTVPSSPLARQFYKLRTILRLRKGRQCIFTIWGRGKKTSVCANTCRALLAKTSCAAELPAKFPAENARDAIVKLQYCTLWQRNPPNYAPV